MLIGLFILSLAGKSWKTRATPIGGAYVVDTPEVVFPGTGSTGASDFSITLSDPNRPILPEHFQSTERLTPEIKQNYDVLYSRGGTPGGTYFNVVMGNEYICNPNFLPHPSARDAFIIVAQRVGLKYDLQHFAEFTCVAEFINGELKCTSYPTILPVTTYPPDMELCKGEFQYMSFTDGPHDARVFHGPQHPYAIFGAQSRHTCFGQWIQDLSGLVGPANSDYDELPEFIRETEIQRPAPIGYMEKNYFVFWDQYNNIHAHHDIFPNRSFSRISADGSSGENLAELSAEHDQKCMKRWMPKVDSKEDSIHQATNSLSITLCKRADHACRENAETLIFHVFHWKTFNGPKFVGHYEPYVMLFRQTAPFELYGISKKPFWFNGRLLPGDPLLKNDRKTHEMLYVTSMSWKSRDQNYHGYLDDSILLGFGVEDEQAAGMDVLAGDLFKNLGLCDSD